MDDSQVRQIIEAAIFAADSPLSRQAIQELFDPGFLDAAGLAKHLEWIKEQYQERGIELVEVASGFRFQVKKTLGPWVSRLWQEKAPRYSRALLETLALIAYRQPTTRGEIEDVRGVAVSSQIIKTLLERNWVRVVGHRDVPGRPALYATTRQFLDYFELTSLDQLPTLPEIRDLDEINRELSFDEAPEKGEDGNEFVDVRELKPLSAEPADVLTSEEEQADLARVDAVLDDFDNRFKRSAKADNTEETNTEESKDNEQAANSFEDEE